MYPIYTNQLYLIYTDQLYTIYTNQLYLIYTNQLNPIYTNQLYPIYTKPCNSYSPSHPRRPIPATLLIFPMISAVTTCSAGPANFRMAAPATRGGMSA